MFTRLIVFPLLCVCLLLIFNNISRANHHQHPTATSNAVDGHALIKEARANQSNNNVA